MKIYKNIFKRRTTGDTMKPVGDTGFPTQQKRLMIDTKLEKKLQKKISKAMSLLSDAAVDALYISRFKNKESDMLNKEVKKIQEISIKIENNFRSKAPMEIWDENTRKTANNNKKSSSWRDKHV